MSRNQYRVVDFWNIILGGLRKESLFKLMFASEENDHYSAMARYIMEYADEYF